MQAHFSPRIYSLQSAYVKALTTNKNGHLHTHLASCSAMGFDHVLIVMSDPLLARPNAGLNGPFNLPEVSAFSFADQELPLTLLKKLVQACNTHHLRLLIDLKVDQLHASHPLVRTHSKWFSGNFSEDRVVDAEPLPDPRIDPVAANTRFARFDRGDVTAGLLDYWQQQLAIWVQLGIAGFRCVAATRASALFWKSLIEVTQKEVHDIKFIFWSCGCTTAQVAAFEHCGFDASFSSVPWWDFKAEWFLKEHAQLIKLGSPCSFPAPPDGMGWQHFSEMGAALVERSQMLRALNFAAAVGSGWLVPMGFEFGIYGMVKNYADFVSQRLANGIDLTNEIMIANTFVGSLGVLLGDARLRVLSSPGAEILLLHRISDTQSEGNSGGILILVNTDCSDVQSLNRILWQQKAGGYLAGKRLLAAPKKTVESIALRMGRRLGMHLDRRVAEQGMQDDFPLDAHHDDRPESLIDSNILTLLPSEIRVYAAIAARPILVIGSHNKHSVQAAVHAPRIALENITPAVDDGRFPVKYVLGDSVRVEVTVLVDGHDRVAVALLSRGADEKEWKQTRMRALGNDRWAAQFPLARLGRHFFAVEAWYDSFLTYREQLEKKVNAGLDVTLEIAEGQLLVKRALDTALRTIPGEVGQHEDTGDVIGELKVLHGALIGANPRGIKQSIAAVVLKISQTDSSDCTEKSNLTNQSDSSDQSLLEHRLHTLLAPQTAALMAQADVRPFAVRSLELPIDAERQAAQYANWYELFPRSQSGDPQRHGTFSDVIQRLPAIREMGFNTLYFPPIHPIGVKHRKGKNNAAMSLPEDLGSPYAIGGDSGGHNALHPELGTFDDFRKLLQAVTENGMELALDFAIQCSPDHPWLRQHPDWFDWRPDGSIRYAENPPKKYEDIVNVDFYTDGAMPNLWLALRDVVLFWVREGVRIFRVDNPHTKPLPFWEWMIADVRGRHPDTIFLAEAFTRPNMMYRLAKIGFSQSYTYFTWRHTKNDFVDYLSELTKKPVAYFFRPHFFVNTPDINPYFLQNSGRPGFLIRAALATTLSGLWGMYSGFELCEASAVRGKEEYLDSEKYQIRTWDWERPGNIIAEISLLNRIRNNNPALQKHLGLQFYQASNQNILYFSKATLSEDEISGSYGLDRPDQFGDNVILVAINLDPFSAHSAEIEVPLWRFGLADDAVVVVEDLMRDTQWEWHGKMQRVTLDPFSQPFAIWRISPKNSSRFSGV